jgi:predicted DNA-binding protein (MmcQ/YjbR family)
VNIEWIREHCLSLPQATEKMQWGDHLLFCIGGRMFAIAPLSPQDVKLSLKATPERFAELVEIEGIIPAPYLARAMWVGFERLDAIRTGEIKELLSESYRLVRENLPKKLLAELEGKTTAEKKAAAVGGKKPAAKKKSSKKKIAVTKKKASR